MDIDRTLLIANPAAAGGRVGRTWHTLLGELHSALGAPVPAVLTEHQGHASVLAADAVRAGITTILSLGGDGTHGEVTAGILAAEPAPATVTLGVLHAGTGGDFRRMLPTPDGDAGPAAYARLIRDAAAHPIDVGRASWGAGQSRVFLNEVSLGMSAAVTHRVNRSKKRLGGKLTFFTSTLSALATYRPPEVRVRVDGSVLGEFSISTVMIANGQYAGGSIHFAPTARLDGALDVVVIQQGNPLRMLALAAHMYDGTLLDQGLVVSARGAVVEVEPVAGVAPHIEADGETLDAIPLRAEVVPGAIRLLAAPAPPPR